MTFMYERQRFHKTALTETQSGKMQEAVTKAEHTIQQRLADCPAPIMLRGQCSSDRRSPAVRPNAPFVGSLSVWVCFSPSENPNISVDRTGARWNRDIHKGFWRSSTKLIS